MNVPFTVEELKDLSSVYLDLGTEDPLWLHIGALMNGGLEYKDRSNFLAVLSDAEGLTGDFVELLVDKLGDEERTPFLSTARRNGSGQDLANLIDATKAFTGDLDRMMNFFETARSLDPAVDQDFLHAAAAAGKNLDKLIDLTNRVEGFMKTDFLIVADNLADRPNAEYLMGNFLATTDKMLVAADEFYSDHYSNMDEETRERYRPNTLFLDKEFKGRHVLEGYFASAAFLVGNGISDSDMNDWLQSWKGIPPQTGEDLVV